MDWIQIMVRAIAVRPTSRQPDPVWEWRNAGDQSCGAFIDAPEERGILKTLKERVTGSCSL